LISAVQTSGIGRELGEYGLANYTEVKTVIIAL
jgi:acyl-CoA reductase-like NAD-dependent aldehyde dehydrogenase